jgi:hypothetical protein
LSSDSEERYSVMVSLQSMLKLAPGLLRVVPWADLLFLWLVICSSSSEEELKGLSVYIVFIDGDVPDLVLS